MGKKVKKKDEEENWRIGKEIAWIGNGRKKRRGWKWKTAKEGNVKEYWGNHHYSIIGIWRGREEWGREKEMKKEQQEKRGGNSGKGRATDDKSQWSQANEWGKLNWNNKKWGRIWRNWWKKFVKY